MKNKYILIFCLLVIVQYSFGQQDTILGRYKHYLFATSDVSTKINELIKTLNKNGQWPDINYKDKENGSWKPLIHLKRIRELSLAYSKSRSPYYHQRKVLLCIGLAIDHWLKNRYQCPNWWHNEIGVPQQMRDIIILLGPSLTSGQVQGALQVVAQYRVHNNSTGANLTWSADLGLHFGLLTMDSALTRTCRDLIVGEIKITSKDGVQPDYSFH